MECSVCIVGPSNTIDWHSPWRDILRAWHDHVAGFVIATAGKLGQTFLRTISETSSAWHAKDAKDEGFMATLRSGGLFTSKVKSRIACSVSPNCALCEELDGMSHRAYHCPATKNVRIANNLQHLEHVPKSCLVWGLFEKPLRAKNIAVHWMQLRFCISLLWKIMVTRFQFSRMEAAHNPVRKACCIRCQARV